MEKFLYAEMMLLEERHWWFKARRRVIQKLISRLNLRDGVSILDCGCGTGGNLKMFAGFGEVTGLEPDSWAADVARARGVGNIYKGSLPDNLPVLGQRYEVIAVLDVLEHIEDDVGALKKLSSLLAEDGIVIITVPAFGFLWSSHDELNHHKRRYSEKQLKRAIEAAGLKPVYITYYNFWLFPAIAFVRLLSKALHGRKRQTDLWLPHRLFNTILYIIFASESMFIGRLKLPFGVSLLAVAAGRSM